MVEQLAHLLCNWKILKMILGLELGYCDGGFLWLSSVPPDTCWVNILKEVMTAFFHSFYNLLFPFILTYDIIQPIPVTVRMSDNPRTNSCLIFGMSWV
jgi:hypothetical protein